MGVEFDRNLGSACNNVGFINNWVHQGVQNTKNAPPFPALPQRYAVYQLLEPDGHMETLSFGVTKRAVLPNTAAVCGRSTFHSEQRCMEQLCRQVRRQMLSG